MDASRPRLCVSEELTVELRRLEPHASWGFRMYEGVFPLRVCAVTPEFSGPVRQGDEIIEVNGTVLESYQDGMSLLHRASSTVRLRIRREADTGDQMVQLEAESGALKCEHLEADTDNWRKGDLTRSSSPSPERKPAVSPQRLLHTPRESPVYPSHNCSGSAGRTSAQLELDRVLVAACAKDAQRARMDAPGLVNVEGQQTPNDNCSLADTQAAALWRDILSRKRKRLDGSLKGADNYKDVCSVLPKLNREVMYDSHACPFSAEEGFTSDFHQFVQHFMTELALSGKHGTDEAGEDSDVKTAVAPARGTSKEDESVVLVEIDAENTRCAVEVEAHRNDGGDAGGARAFLDSQQQSMLKMVATYREGLLPEQRKKEEWYRAMECRVQDFFALHSKIISWCRKASTTHPPVDHKAKKSPMFHVGNREVPKRHDSISQLLPPSSPQTLQQPQPYLPPSLYQPIPHVMNVASPVGVSPHAVSGYTGTPVYSRRQHQPTILPERRLQNPVLYHRQ